MRVPCLRARRYRKIKAERARRDRRILLDKIEADLEWSRDNSKGSEWFRWHNELFIFRMKRRMWGE